MERRLDMARRSAAGAPAAAPAMAKSAASAREEAVAEDLQDVELATASVEQGLLSATFTAPRRASRWTAPGRRGRSRCSASRSRRSSSASPRRAVEAATFLTAKATNETGFPLLPGVAGIYVGDEFVGRAPVPMTPPGGEIELAFGVDDRVEIERKVLERKRLTAGLVSKDEVYRYRVRIEVKNRYATPIAVKLLDLVPVTRDEKIKVAVLDGRRRRRERTRSAPACGSTTSRWRPRGEGGRAPLRGPLPARLLDRGAGVEPLQRRAPRRCRPRSRRSRPRAAPPGPGPMGSLATAKTGRGPAAHATWSVRPWRHAARSRPSETTRFSDVGLGHGSASAIRSTVSVVSARAPRTPARSASCTEPRARRRVRNR